MENEKSLATQLHDLSLVEKMLWHQQARTNWLGLGDKNTSYFQSQALIRKKRKQIIKIKNDNGFWVDDPIEIAHIFNIF